ncbi:protein of unknown function [Methylocella tundrae]|uniref:Uncharacterized protein n=1 Tax=Methylocella tundrae TaxID=227605 RepID=A0A4U8Z1H7_METTU|nr:protein of unknown function [Methylocella tundrae]
MPFGRDAIFWAEEQELCKSHQTESEFMSTSAAVKASRLSFCIIGAARRAPGTMSRRSCRSRIGPSRSTTAAGASLKRR